VNAGPRGVRVEALRESGESPGFMPCQCGWCNSCRSRSKSSAERGCPRVSLPRYTERQAEEHLRDYWRGREIEWEREAEEARKRGAARAARRHN